MSLDALYSFRLPDWSRELRNLYWWLRYSKGCLNPQTSPRTWHRRIKAEKQRLIESGVSPFEVHAVSRMFVSAGPRDRFRYNSAQHRYQSMVKGAEL